MKTSSQRIDQVLSIRPMSCNLEGHENRMRNHIARVEREYFDKGLNRAGRPKKTIK